jgi:hypothetical protein
MRNWRVDLGNGYWTRSKPQYYKIDDDGIEKVEKLRNCRFVTEWTTLDSRGNAIDQPVLIFWNDTPHPQGSNWMGLFRDYHNGAWYVKDGITASQLPIQCVVSNDKEVLFSKNSHHFNESVDKSVAIDGGRDYTRIIGNVECERVWMVPYYGELKLIPETMAQLMLDKSK